MFFFSYSTTHTHRRTSFCNLNFDKYKLIWCINFSKIFKTLEFFSKKDFLFIRFSIIWLLIYVYKSLSLSHNRVNFVYSDYAYVYIYVCETFDSFRSNWSKSNQWNIASGGNNVTQRWIMYRSMIFFDAKME